MRRAGRYLRVACLLAVAAAALAAPRLLHGDSADPPTPTVNLSFEAPEPKAMPPEVAAAVRLLVRTPPSAGDPIPDQKPLAAEPAPATKSAFENAISILLKRKPAETISPIAIPPANPPIRPTANDPDRDAKLKAVDRAIGDFNASISKVEIPELPPLVVTISGQEEQDATKSAVAKAAAQVLGQLPEPPQSLPPMIANIPPAPTSCPTCGRGHGLGKPVHRLHDREEPFCATCGGGWRCSPGHPPCEPCHAHDGPMGRLFCCFYECLCCPDPCYDPQWRQVANAALFVDGARPVTQTEIRYNAGRGGVFPDRSEFFWARADGMGRGPRPPAGIRGERRFDFDDLVLITETAKDKLSAIIEMPYRAVSPEFYPHGAGFGDMAIGTKTLLFDCELVQVSMQFKTYLPTGNTLKGVGTGHVTLEPSLLAALKLTNDTYAQGQVSEWIPIGGDPNYMGSVFHTHASVNHVLYRFGPEIPLVGTLEANTYSFQDGAYTDPVLGPFQKSSGTTYVSAGPGLRLMFCDKLDIGFGTVFSLSEQNFAKQYYRTSVRLRF